MHYIYSMHQKSATHAIALILFDKVVFCRATDPPPDQNNRLIGIPPAITTRKGKMNMEKCNTESQRLEINEPEILENRSSDPVILKKVWESIAVQFLRYVSGQVVKNARKVPGHGTPAAPVGQAFILNRILWIDIPRVLAEHNPFRLDLETVEDALIEHPGYVTDAIVKVPGEADRFVIGVDLFAAGVRCWF